MRVQPFSALACPLDGEPLTEQTDQGTAWRCPAGHSFDVARQGYVNLLPVQNKRSLDPGDSKTMVSARQRFLASGFYQPIADAVCEAVLSLSGESLGCLDAGCGEGYYLRELAARITSHASGVDLALIGLDISKWATLAAAKRQKQARWVVGTNAHLPIQSGSLDCVLCLFGFPVYEEFRRVLKPHGQIIQVDAGPDHLRELRDIVYPVIKPARPASDEAPQGFSLARTLSVRYSLSLENPSAIADLLAMTPHLYRASAEGRARAEALTTLTVTVDVSVRVFQVVP